MSAGPLPDWRNNQVYPFAHYPTGRRPKRAPSEMIRVIYGAAGKKMGVIQRLLCYDESAKQLIRKEVHDEPKNAVSVHTYCAFSFRTGWMRFWSAGF